MGMKREGERERGREKDGRERKGEGRIVPVKFCEITRSCKQNLA